jgi:SAM-dependent methyltransferase
MPGIEKNERHWSRAPWRKGGDRWSRHWGGPDYQWLGMMYPRVREFVPAPTILEIGCGHGRWTRYLIRLCDRLIGVDLTARCVEACRERFAGEPRASFHKNDGKSLAVVPDGEVDFAFSFDALIHCEGDVVQAYVEQLAHKLTPDGAAFLHHSNLAAYANPQTGALAHRNRGWRGRTVSAALFEQYCRDAGLVCIGQELVRWWEDYPAFSDCFSMLTRPGSRFARENRVVENPGYVAQAGAMARVAELYGPTGFPALEERPAGLDPTLP